MNYELVVMIKPSLTEEQAKKKSDSIKGLITELEGKTEKEDFWGKRKLAYEIKRMQEAYYASLNFQFPEASVKKLSSKLSAEPDVVRYLLTASES